MPGTSGEVKCPRCGQTAMEGIETTPHGEWLLGCNSCGYLKHAIFYGDFDSFDKYYAEDITSGKMIRTELHDDNGRPHLIYERYPLKTTVININNGDEYDVYIGRAGKGYEGIFGNPFSLIKDNKRTREKCISQYREYFYNRLETDTEFKRRVLELRGKVLGCFCLPQKLCHGTVIAEYLNNLENKE